MIAIIGSLFFSIAVIIYILLIFGAELGEFAMGGKYKVLPKKLRVACAISVFIQLFAIIIILQAGNMIPLMFSSKVTKYICLFFAFYLSINSIMNILSKSKKEKFIMTPISIITAICFWVVALGV